MHVPNNPHTLLEPETYFTYLMTPKHWRLSIIVKMYISVPTAYEYSFGCL